MTSYLSSQLKKTPHKFEPCVNWHRAITHQSASTVKLLKKSKKDDPAEKITWLISPVSYFSVSIYQRGCDVHSKFLFDVKFQPSCRWKSGPILASLQFAYFCAMMYSCHCKSVYLHPKILQPRTLHPKILHPRILHPRILHPKILHPPSICDCITTCEHGIRICWCKIAPAIYQQPDAINILTNK